MKVIHLLVVIHTVIAVQNSVEFYTSLFNGYNPDVRPVAFANTTTVVETQCHYLTILNYEHSTSTLTLSINLELNWTDEFLQWTPSAENGYVQAIVVPIDKIWKPQVVFYTGNTEEMTEKSVVRVHCNGMVEFSLIRLLYNHCPMDLHQFPFDEQKCFINITTWSYTNSEVFLNPEESIDPDNGTNTTNGEMVVTGIYGFSDPYNADLKYVIYLRRRPSYYVTIVMIPTFIAASMCLLGLFIPKVNTGVRFTKMYLSLCVIFFMYQILDTASAEITKANYLPNLASYIFTELLLCAVAAVTSVVLLVLHHYITTVVKKKRNPPNWLLRLSCQKIVSHRVTSARVRSAKARSDENWSTSLVQDEDYDRNGLYRQVLDKSEHFLLDHRWETERVRRWTCVFDTIDFILSIVFQIINIIIFIVFVT